MTAPRPGLSGLLRFETYKLATRSLPWVFLAIIVLTTLIMALIEHGSESKAGGYQLYAYLLSHNLPLTTFLVLILGALGVNRELGSGSMRALLLRPVRRSEVVIAKTLVLFLFSLGFGLVALLSAWGITEFLSDFGAIVIVIEGLDSKDAISAEHMRVYALTLSCCAVIPIVAAAAFGNLISVLVESEGNAVAGVMVASGAMYAFGTTNPKLGPWLFPYYVDQPLTYLTEFSREVTDHVDLVKAIDLSSPAVLAPIAMAVVFSLISVVVFTKKDLPC